MSNEHPRTRAAAKDARRNRSQKVKKKRRLSWPKRILLTLFGLFLAGVAVLGIAYARTVTPKPNDIATAQTSIIYFSDGKTEMDRVSEINRQSVKLVDIPKHAQEAMLAAEDRNFYQNQGISPTGIARAVWVAIKGGGATQGGSTITQQYVKNYFLSQDRTLTRKFREILISVKIDKQQSKQQILENYLNTIYYGRGAYGIQTASKAYFNKDVSQLTVSESALLASVIRGPSYYDPGLGKEQLANATDRWKYVLDGMVSQGWLSAESRATQTFPKVADWKPKVTSGPNGYLTQIVKNELRNRLKLTDADIDRGGLKIVTTIDRNKQAAAITAVRDRMPEGAPDLRVGLASVVPGDGAVVALYGGADFAKNQYNAATQASMQAGSTFKIFTLIAALQSGDVSMRNTFDGNSPVYFNEFKDSGAATERGRQGGVQNFGNHSYGWLSVKQATARSSNTVFARLNIIATPKKTVAAAQTAGIGSKLTANYANVFGTDHVKVLEMANAYATIAAEGVRATPYFVKSVTSPEGQFDYKAKPAVKQVFDKKLMADVIDGMRAVTESGTATYAQNLGRASAGKTGTTTDNKAAWFDGYVPQLATAVGVFRPGPNGEELSMDNIPGVGELTGATVPLRIWTDYMKKALEGTEVVRFPQPGNVNSNAAPRQSYSPQPRQTTSGPRPTTSAPSPTASTPSPTTSTPAPTVSTPPPTTQAPPTQPPPTTQAPPTQPPPTTQAPTTQPPVSPPATPAQPPAAVLPTPGG